MKELFAENSKVVSIVFHENIFSLFCALKYYSKYSLISLLYKRVLCGICPSEHYSDIHIIDIIDSKNRFLRYNVL